MATVSVIIPVYNRADVLGNAIESVLQQTVKVDEIIVVDDGSTDALLSVVEAINCSRLRLVSQKNQGVSVARNVGVQLATSEYVAFLDSDDTWLPEKIEVQLAYMQEHDYNVCVGEFLIGENLANRPYKNHLTYADFAWGCFVAPGSTLMCKKEVFESAGGYDAHFVRFEDWDLLLRLSASNLVGWVDRPLASIFPANDFSANVGLDSLVKLEDRHGKQLKLSGLHARFTASKWFHQSRLSLFSKHYIKFVLQMVASFFRHPLGHVPICSIMLASLKNKLDI